MTTLTIDIETFHTEDAAFIAQVTEEITAACLAECEAVRAPGNYKDAVKIDEWMATEGARKINAIRDSAAAQIDEKIRATSFDGCLGHIAAIGYAIDEQPAQVIYADDTSPAKHEKSILARFYAELNVALDGSTRPVVVGHNHVGFDLRFMLQRSIILGVKPSPYLPFNAKPWDDNVFDTMVRWAGVGNRVKLDKLAKALGLPGKQGIDGSMVADYIKAGKISEVAEYCKDDVEQTRAIYRRMTFTHLLAA